jgi:hypothetical protein
MGSRARQHPSVSPLVARDVIGNAKIADFMVESRFENYTVFQVHIFMPILFPDVTGIPA